MDTISTFPPSIQAKLKTDEALLKAAADDYGHIIHRTPAAVFHPDSSEDIVQLIKHANAHGLKVIAKGQGHNTHGHAQLEGAIVVDMNCLNKMGELEWGAVWVDAGMCWDDLLVETLKVGKTPPIITDYPHVTIGGTICVGGVGAQTFKVGTQTDNVLALEVVTGAGELLTCSATENPDLFDACRAGLGQVGIITKAQVRLVTAPSMMRFYRTFHTDLKDFIATMHRLIQEQKFDTIQGFAVPNVNEVIAQIYGPEAADFPRQPQAGKWLYMLELGKYSDEPTSLDNEAQLAGLNIIDGAMTFMDLPYYAYVRRLDMLVEALQAMDIWTMPHPWVNLLIGGTNAEQFIGTALEELNPDDLGQGAILMYPYNKTTFKTPQFSIPNDDYILKFALLRNALPPAPEQVEKLIAANRKLYDDCVALGGTRYPIDSVPMAEADWERHFGAAYASLEAAKTKYNPNGVLGPILG